MRYIIYAGIEVELNVEDPEKAKEKAGEIFDKLEKDNKEVFLVIKSAKVADKASGYFV